LELNRGKVGLNSENRGVNCVDCVHSQVQYSQIDDSPNLRGLGNKMSICDIMDNWCIPEATGQADLVSKTKAVSTAS
jgi:hypothetical protein